MTIDLRLQYLAERVHTLGPAPLYHLIKEIEAGADMRPTLERYAALPANFVRAMDGSEFGPRVSLIKGGRADERF
jgi:hypothetical protein